MCEILSRYRVIAFEEYNKNLTSRVENILSSKQEKKSYEKAIEKAVIRSILFEDNFGEIFENIIKAPVHRNNIVVSFEEFYNALVKYAGFHAISYQLFIFLLNEIEEKHFYRQITNKDEAELIYLVRSIEELSNDSNIKKSDILEEKKAMDDINDNEELKEKKIQ